MNFDCNDYSQLDYAANTAENIILICRNPLYLLRVRIIITVGQTSSGSPQHRGEHDERIRNSESSPTTSVGRDWKITNAYPEPAAHLTVDRDERAPEGDETGERAPRL